MGCKDPEAHRIKERERYSNPEHREKVQAYYRINRQRILSYKKKFREENHSEVLQRERDCKKLRPYRKIIANPTTPNYRLSKYRHSAKIRGHGFDLSKEEFMTFWQKPCHYCGDPISTIGIDRIDSAKGYVVDNCVPCCGPCNRAKMSVPYQEFIDRACRIAARHKSCINM